MRTVCVIATHQRHAALNIVLAHLPADWQVVVVVTDEADAQAMEPRDGLHVVRHPNEPLGAKWQHGVEKARTLNPDLLVITGSDDVLLTSTPGLASLMTDCDMLGLRGFYAYNGRQHWFFSYKSHVPMPIGGGRVYTRAILDRMRWRLFDTEKNKHLDEYGYANVVRHGGAVKQLLDDAAFRLVALKGEWPQKNPLAKYLRGKNLNVKPLRDVRHSVTYQW
jgi:hypothetical protein